MLKTAVIGVGYLGRFHAQKYAGFTDSELIGVVDVDSQQAQKGFKATGRSGSCTLELFIIFG